MRKRHFLISVPMAHEVVKYKSGRGVMSLILGKANTLESDCFLAVPSLNPSLHGTFRKLSDEGRVLNTTVTHKIYSQHIYFLRVKDKEADNIMKGHRAHLLFVIYNAW
jgi:hypothetical protein